MCTIRISGTKGHRSLKIAERWIIMRNMQGFCWLRTFGAYPSDWREREDYPAPFYSFSFRLLWWEVRRHSMTMRQARRWSRDNESRRSSA